MASDGILTRWYRGRIGTPTTDDEVYGYWLFVAGIVLGALGLGLFYGAGSRSTLREFGYVFAAVGVIALFVGPTMRLPLSRKALFVSYAAALVSLAATLWFTLIYPAGWTGPEGNPAVTLYMAGLALAAIGAVVAPLLTGRQEAYEQAQKTAAEATAAAEQASETAERATAERSELAEDLATSESARENLSELLGATEGELDAAQAAIAAAMESKATFELYADKAGKYRWRLRHRNGNVIADSAQGYASRQKAMQGLRSVQTNAAGGAVVLLADGTEEDTVEDVPEVPAPDSQGTFELFEDKGGEFRWRLRHDNGNVLADSGEGYASKSNVRRALKSVRAYVPGAAYLQVDPVAFEVYADKAGRYRWRLLHRNGEILGDSGEGYDTRAAARRAANEVRTVAPDADDEFEVYEDKGGEFRWRLRTDEGIIADSGEGYTERNKAVNAVERVQQYAADADLLAIGSAAFEIYEDRAEEWRWRLRHRNGQIIADSGEGFGKRSGAVASIERVKRHGPAADQSE
ncbi:YegP family protein [Halomicroarcula sp. F28]|uniref:HVO_2922 family protein n=1 Tax=Haloarcula salinisoli TaxID=2487746 RepID=UPI001C72E92B|nr:HVO_2922 family protein [Halomicroarcula salinisoli]MBX0286935.1 YegP family protein [Halomicroarcula salinisoli]